MARGLAAGGCQRRGVAGRRRARSNAATGACAQAAAALAAVGLCVLALAPPRPLGFAKTAYRPYRPSSCPLAPPPSVEVEVPPTAEEIEQGEIEVELQGCAPAGAWECAGQLLERLRNRSLPIRRQSWNFALKAAAMAGRWEVASALLDTMGEATMPPDHTAYHAAIEACEGEAASQQVLKLVRVMLASGLSPNMVTYLKVLTKLLQQGLNDEAQELFLEAYEKGFLQMWTDRGRILDVQELPIEVAEVAVRYAVEERAEGTLGSTAGKGGFYVTTGPGFNKATNTKQDAVLRVLRQEYGLKVRVDPAVNGRVKVRGTELQQLAQERGMGGAPRGSGSKRQKATAA